MSANLQWTGHALADIGIATLCAMAEKSDPAELTLEDLKSACDSVEPYYSNGSMTAYLTCVFPNSGYVNPTMSDKNRQEYRQRILRAYCATPDAEARGQYCVFSGEPATHLVDRTQIPLLTGAGVLNFFPAAAGGCFIAGQYLTALQMVPLGGRRTDGRLLVAHADAPELNIGFARRYLEDNRRFLSLAPGIAAGTALDRSKPWAGKSPDASSPRSLITSDLMDILRRTKPSLGSVTAYWLTNSGQGPALDIFTIPTALVRFVGTVQREGLERSWNSLIGQGWRRERDKAADGTRSGSTKKSKQNPVGPGRSPNRVLEELLLIFESGAIHHDKARQFVRNHFLRVAYGEQRLRTPKEWRLTDLFLTEVLGMNKEHLEKIRVFADKLANYIQTRNDRKLLNSMLFGARRPWDLRLALAKAQRQAVSRGSAVDLLFGLDEYVDVFEAEDSVGLANWSLIRDLISIRLVETLHGLGWNGLKEVAAEEPESDEEQLPVLQGEED